MDDQPIIFLPPEARQWNDGVGFGKEQAAMVHEGSDKVRVALFKKPAGWHLPWHSHTEWTVMTVLDGRMKIEQEGVPPFEAMAGAVYYIPPGRLHAETALAETTSVVVYHPAMAVEYRDAAFSQGSSA